MSEPRKRLPNRREHELVDFVHGGFCFTAGLGRYPGGGLAEIFLNAEKVGTAVETTARDAAILASFALQHGASVDELRKAVTRDTDGAASGALGFLLDLLASEAE